MCGLLFLCELNDKITRVHNKHKPKFGGAMRFKEYVIKNKWIWLLVLLFTLLCRGEMMLSESIGIDTADIIADKDGMYYSWLGIGRQGLVFLKWITGSLVFNTYFVGVGTIVMLTLVCILWGYLFVYVSGKESRIATLFFSGILVSHTILTEQLYFKLQAFEICTALCLMAIVVLCGHMFAVEKRRWAFIISIPLMLIVFSVYQVMNALFLFGAVACFFLYYFFWLPEEKSGKELWIYILRFAEVFLVGFILNQVSTALFFSNAEYVNNQIRWGQMPFADCILSILTHVKNVALGENVFYIKTFSLFAVILIVQVVFSLKNSKQASKYLGILCLILLFMSPFYMTLIIGGLNVARSQLVLPFTLAFMGYVTCLFKVKGEKLHRILKIAVWCVGCLTLVYQVSYTMKLNHTGELRYESDVQVADALMEDIMEYQNADCSRPVVFIGGHEEPLEDDCLYGDCLGESVLNWDTKVEPQGYYSTLRIVNFMETRGTEFRRGNEDETLYAYKVTREMNDWPAEDSIRLVMDLIIVRLGE